MVETIFGVLFLLTLASLSLAVVVGVVMLVWPARKASRPAVGDLHALAHR